MCHRWAHAGSAWGKYFVSRVFLFGRRLGGDERGRKYLKTYIFEAICKVLGFIEISARNFYFLKVLKFALSKHFLRGIRVSMEPPCVPLILIFLLDVLNDSYIDPNVQTTITPLILTFKVNLLCAIESFIIIILILVLAFNCFVQVKLLLLLVYLLYMSP